MNSDLAKRYHDDGMAVMSKPQLLLSLYERLATDLQRAVQGLSDGEIEVSHNALVHAQDIVHELNLALDVERWEGGHNLRAIYNHVSSLLIEANMTKSPEPVRQCIELIGPLNDAWQEAAVIAAAQRVQTAPATSAGGTVRVNG
jgi:flagellar protein FliS